MKQPKKKNMTRDKAYRKNRGWKMLGKLISCSMAGIIMLAISPEAANAAGPKPSVPFKDTLDKFMYCVLPYPEYEFMRDNEFAWNIKLHYDLLPDDIQNPTPILTGCLIIHKWFNAFGDDDILSQYENVTRLVSPSTRDDIVHIVDYLFESSPNRQCGSDEPKYQLMDLVYRQCLSGAEWIKIARTERTMEKSLQNYEHRPERFDKQMRRIMREADENSRVMDSIRRNSEGP